MKMCTPAHPSPKYQKSHMFDVLLTCEDFPSSAGISVRSTKNVCWTILRFLFVQCDLSLSVCKSRECGSCAVLTSAQMGVLFTAFCWSATSPPRRNRRSGVPSGPHGLENSGGSSKTIPHHRHALLRQVFPALI